MKHLLFFFILVVSFGLSGCVNLKPKADTVQNFVLGSIEPSPVENGAGAVNERDAEAAIYVGRPDLPGYLEGNRLQYRTEAGAVQTLSGARWGEPMQEGVARALSEYLVRSGRFSEGAYYPWPVQSAAIPRLRVRFHQFTATADGRILMNASWQMSTAEGVIDEGSFSSSDLSWEPGDAESLVGGLNRSLELLAEAIADDAPTN